MHMKFLWIKLQVKFPFLRPLPFLLCHYLAHLPLPISAGCTSLPLGFTPKLSSLLGPSLMLISDKCLSLIPTILNLITCCSVQMLPPQEGSPPRSSVPADKNTDTAASEGTDLG